MTDDSKHELLLSMLEETEVDEWGDLPIGLRFELLAQEMDNADDLSEEQARWLKEESEKAMEDFQDAFEPVRRTLVVLLQDIAKNMQPLLKQTQDIENND